MRAKSSPPSIYDYSYEELSDLTSDAEAEVIYRQLYVERRRRSSEIDGLREIARIPEPAALTRSDVVNGSMTAKYLFGLRDGGAVEAVRIQRRTGMTACVSSQVGCGFACQFCASGRLGLRRHLSAGEIIQQVLELGHGVNRVVFMGIGEPLHNYDNVLKAIRVLRDRRGLDLPSSGITISTIGIPKRLKQLREEHLKINLTVSLHGTTDEVRHELIPGSRRHEIGEVVSLSQVWARRHNRTVTYVYLVLPGVTDSRDDLKRLQRWFAHDLARVNLMRWNPVEGGSRFKRASDRTLHWFRQSLEAAGVKATVRDTQGRDVDAACGQLWLRNQAGEGSLSSPAAPLLTPSRGSR